MTKMDNSLRKKGDFVSLFKHSTDFYAATDILKSTVLRAIQGYYTSMGVTRERLRGRFVFQIYTR